MGIVTINPTNEQKIGEYCYQATQELEQSINLAHNQYRVWKHAAVTERQQLLERFADQLEAKKTELSQLITLEMGKPITQSQAEIDKCVSLCRHYAIQSEHYLASRVIKNNFSKTEVHYRPLGVVLAVMPWNFPFWQVLRCAIPSLMAGNAVVLKHAPISSGAALAIASLFEQAGFPKGLFQSLIITNQQTEQLLKHPYISGLSFTGSEKIGRHLGSLAAASLKKAVLELGGNDPYLVCEDADLDLAAQTIITSRLNNCGQVCIAAKRIIAHTAIYNPLIEKLLHRMKSYVPGDPTYPTTTLGPLAREDLRQTLVDQVNKTIAGGACLLAGGNCVPGPGYYYEPTLLSEVKPGMCSFEEELFGPVLAVTRAASEKNMIELANQSNYGLGAAIFTNNLPRGEEIATFEIESGSCFVNALVASDPAVPFGGIKHSGYGRELSREGIHEFVNIKTVAIR